MNFPLLANATTTCGMLATLLLVINIPSTRTTSLPSKVLSRSPDGITRTIQDRTFILPPKFPDKAPYGWFGSAILCPWLVGPKAPFYWNRACAGPVPPFRKPRAPKKVMYPLTELSFEKETGTEAGPPSISMPGSDALDYYYGEEEQEEGYYDVDTYNNDKGANWDGRRLTFEEID